MNSLRKYVGVGTIVVGKIMMIFLGLATFVNVIHKKSRKTLTLGG